MSNPADPASDPAIRAWLAVEEPLELQLAPLGRRAMQALAASPGEHVLDIGCGAGRTTLDLARAVAPGGAVLGVDISAPRLDYARRLAGAAPGVAYQLGDAQTAAFAPGAFDAAFSRFGVMFFADPVAAFANIRKALKPAGRLAFVCWRSLEENDLERVPLDAAAPWLPPTPDAPTHVSFADPDRIRAILSAAGFQAIDIAAHDQPVGSGDLEIMLEVSLRVGALGVILRQAPHLRDPCVAPVRAALATHLGPDGVTLKAATWIVTARA